MLILLGMPAIRPTKPKVRSITLAEISLWRRRLDAAFYASKCDGLARKELVVPKNEEICDTAAAV
jgi:hypothetical protein